MMEFDEVTVKDSPGLCRCCLSEGCYKDLSTVYPWMNESEIYADMLFECFDISISQHMDGPNGHNRLICEVCITRLRDACNFKKQVLDSEKKFIEMLAKGDFSRKVVVYQDDLKAELQEMVPDPDAANAKYLEDDVDYCNDDLMNPDEPTTSVSEGVTAAPLTVKAKRGRPRKKPEDKVEKKIKTKTEQKLKKSRATVKESTVPGEDSNVKSKANNDRRSEVRRRDELTTLLMLILEYSRAMPFRWHSNKYMCFYCCCPFVQSQELRQHTREEHGGTRLRSVIRSLVGSTSIKLDVTDLDCTKCGQPINNFEDLVTHLSESHGLTFESSSSGYIFAYKLSDDSMKCLECGAAYRFCGPLIAHMHKHHTKTKPFLCQICGQVFVAKSNVESHIRSVHSNLTAVRCESCDRTFPSKYALTKHTDNEHGASRYNCTKCSASLRSRFSLKRHLALEHDDESSKFKCETCPIFFTTRSRLLRHMQCVHLKQKTATCSVCGFKTFNKDQLKKHMVSHTDERPYQCEYCQKTFKTKSTYVVHNRIHTNDRRNSCKECGKAFVQWTSLKLHMKVHQ